LRGSAGENVSLRWPGRLKDKGIAEDPSQEIAAELDRITDNTVFIIGAGHFGTRAARIIRQRTHAPVFVVDPNEKGLAALRDLQVELVPDDGIQFLVSNFERIKPADTIVPALPLHLAYEWLIRFLPGDVRVERMPLPDVDRLLPHPCPASEGSTLVSYADFRCPDDCPEPVRCTVTGEKREKPLYALLRDLQVPPFQIHIIRSHQLAPGLGGYKGGDLQELAEKVLKAENRMWILGTACKCHGILTAFELTDLSQRSAGYRGT